MDQNWIDLNDRTPSTSMSFVRILRGNDREPGVAHYNIETDSWLTAEEGKAYKFIILDVTHWRPRTRKLWF